MSLTEEYEQKALEIVDAWGALLPRNIAGVAVWGAKIGTANIALLVDAIADSFADVEAAAEARARHEAVVICRAKADSLRLGAEDGIAPAYAEDIELCEELARRIAGKLSERDWFEKQLIAAEAHGIERAAEVARLKAAEYRHEAESGGSDLWSAKARAADVIEKSIRALQPDPSYSVRLVGGERERIKEILRRMLNRKARQRANLLLPDVLAAIDDDERGE